MRHIAAAGGVRRECSQHTINQSRVPLNHGATTATSSISTKRWNEARSINDVRGSMVTEVGSEIASRLIVIILLSSCDAALERRKGCANILTDWLQSSSALAHPSSQASISRRDGEGAMERRFARPRAQHRRDTANHRCAWVQVREEEYLLSFSSSNRVVCDPKETRLARHKDRAIPSRARGEVKRRRVQHALFPSGPPPQY